MTETKTLADLGSNAGLERLLPCPFCGGEPSITHRMDEDIWTHNTVDWKGVHCYECGIGFEWPPDAEPDAVAQWNTRSNGLA